MNTNLLWWNRSQPWVIQIGLLALIGFVAWFGVRPLLDLIQQEQDEIQKIDVLQEYRSAELQRLPELEKQSSLIQERGQELKLMPTKDELVGFIRDLERLAQESGVAIEIASQDNTLLESKLTSQEAKAKVQSETANEGDESRSVAPTDRRKGKLGGTLLEGLPLKQFIRLNLTVKAPYAAMVEYLHKVETMSYALEVVSLAVRELGKEDLDTNVDGGLQLGGTGTTRSVLLLSPTTTLKTDIGLVIFTREE